MLRLFQERERAVVKADEAKLLDLKREEGLSLCNGAFRSARRSSLCTVPLFAPRLSIPSPCPEREASRAEDLKEIARKQRDFQHTYHDEEDDDRYFNSRHLAKLRAMRYNEKVRAQRPWTVLPGALSRQAHAPPPHGWHRWTTIATGRTSGSRRRRR